MDEELYQVSKKNNLTPDEAESFQSFARDERIGLHPDKAFELWSKKWNKETIFSVINYTCKLFGDQHSINEIKKWWRVKEIKNLSSFEEIEIAEWLLEQLKEAKDETIELADEV